MSLKKHQLFGLLAVLALLSLAACKIDMEQEIWLKKDNSGSATVKVSMNIPMGLDAETWDSMEMDQTNATSGMHERALATEGIAVTRYEQKTDHNEEAMNFYYYLEFTFKDIAGLSKVLSIEGSDAITLENAKKGRLLTMDARKFDIQVEGSDEEMEYLDFLEMSLITKVNLPKKAKAIDDTGLGVKKGKTVTWTAVIDGEWYQDYSKLLTVLY